MPSQAVADDSSPEASVAVASRHETQGLLLGLLGVLIFAMTLPMTRLAVGSVDAPQLPPLFVTAGRAVGAAVLGGLYLVLTGAPRPQRRHLPAFVVSALGAVIGFPLFLGLALRQVPAVHAAVITGVLPLTTALVAAWHLRQRPSLGFWACAVLGGALVLWFAVLQGGGQLVLADAYLLLAMFSASVAYVAGARLSLQWRAEHVISWMLVISLPVTAPVALAAWPVAAVRPAAWWGFAYVTVFSMWLGFFAWYRGLALGGTLRVSQVQLVQPFLSLLLAPLVLGEPLPALALGFAVAVMLIVFTGKRMSVGAPARPPVVASTTP
jgi:drug/metabolite transporter (DMT)-like permease